MEPEPVARLVADRVRRLRRERGWSAEKLAAECGPGGPTRSTIAKIESGVRKSVSAAEISALAKALSVTPGELMAPDTGEPEWDAPDRPLQSVVDILEQIAGLRDRTNTRFLARLVQDLLGTPLNLTEHTSNRLYLYELVVACKSHREGLRALVDVVDQLFPGEQPVERLRAAVAELEPRDLLTASARDDLLTMLAERHWSRLVEDYRAATGPYAPELGGTDPDTYVAVAEQLNASPRGTPPLFTLVELLAARAGGDLGRRLREWVHHQASAMGVPAPPPATVTEDRPGAFLLVQLEKNLMEADRYVVRHWTQLTSDDLRPGGVTTRPLTLAEVQRHVVDLVTDAEASWAADAEFVRLEFLLPLELLALPVDQWPGQPEGEPSQPLGLRHQIVVRSLDRMLAPRWHRAWRLRWELLDRPESLAGKELVVLSAAEDAAELRRVDAELAATPKAIMVLPHRPRLLPDGDEVFLGLRAGLPAMLWLRDDRFVDSFETEVHDLLTAGRDLPETARLLRGRAFSAADPETHVGSHVTLLWDDPHRVINLSNPLEAPLEMTQG